MKNLPFVLVLLLGACNQVEEAHDQIHGSKRILASYDTDGDGKLSKAELAKADGHAAIVAEHFDALDLDGDGTLDADEMQLLHDDMTAFHADHGAGFFDAADTDHSGTLTAAELAAAPDPGPMVADHMDMVDSDGNGSVTRDELAAAIAKHDQHHE
jgi:Ca2+-binding EF-hand superfamily protein